MNDIDPGGTAEVPPAALSHALRDAHAYFRQPRTLDPSWVPDYLNRRNLYPQLRYAGIGYAPSGWTSLLDHLRGRGHSDEALIGAGLARRASTGNLIDQFRDRLMIPVVDADRHLVGFIGRAAPGADPDTVPKYLNSPTTALFNKGQLLYALGEDRAALRTGALPILVEGPLDRLALRQAAGNLAVVGLAPLGTAFTERQAQQLASLIGPRRPVAVALDSDPAGRQATIKAWDRLTDAGLTNLLHVALPDGCDPADLIRAGHGQRLRQAIIRARPLAIAVADQRIATAGTGLDVQKRYAILQHILGHDLHRVPTDRISPYLAHLGSQLRLDHETVTSAAVARLVPAYPPEYAIEGVTAQLHAAEGNPTVEREGIDSAGNHPRHEPSQPRDTGVGL